MRFVLWIVILAVFCGAPMVSQAGQKEIFGLQFKWGDIPHCNSGLPNVVANPDFALSHVPKGTHYVYFKLVDLDAPKYNHGSAWVSYHRKNIVPTGSFTYKSPCPPKGQTHNYQWVAIADEDQDLKNGYLAMTATRRDYPEKVPKLIP